MENYFALHMQPQEISAISNLGLAHIGDSVFELLCRSWLCAHGGTNVGALHRRTVELVNARAQARFAEAMLPRLSEQELALYRRGKNAHVHAVPKGATPQEYARATGVEALFGAMYLAGETQRLNDLFVAVMEELYGI